MTRRIRSIFWLMTACIVGINAFQGYWLWTTYQLNRDQFVRTVQDALVQALERQQVIDAKQLMRKQPPGKSKRTPTKAGSETRIIVRRFDNPQAASRGGETRVFVQRHIDSLQADKSPERLVVTYNRIDPVKLQDPADTLARRISKLVLLDWAAGTITNLGNLTVIYKDELHRRAIDTEFQLDTLRIRSQETHQQGKDKIFIFRRDITNQAVKNTNVLQTTPEPLNPLQNLFVQATFSTPTSYLLQRMGWLLGSSVILLILTTSCFLFMLATILRQKKLSEVKNDFINNMTHELKTPIATVSAAVEALQNFGVLNDPQKTQTYLTISQNNLQRLSDLVEKVLNLAVEEKRDLVLHPEPIKLADLTNDLIANHRLRAAKPLYVSTHIPPEATISVDRIHFSNALNNLIDNAINYSRDQADIRLTFQQRANDGWKLVVADNGIGIPKVYQSAIFDRFFRVPTGNLHPVKGFGLGLAYVQQVVERHGGRIRVQSEPGKGSEFILEF
ncbi:sensor histidine kinase [Spirosoma foliorum]|uniref:histidine kinase n=1 Tax=Spirosoma foliorum TaxID=2710596 RepID=A0A7G5GSC6_9BACT|nr:HAMP domain-containing sensor histidine kinase [Spirosoma foliorum]QMW01768.1 HAMP domain-containing histidine kinase [Spirosoma foliorum]